MTEPREPAEEFEEVLRSLWRLASNWDWKLADQARTDAVAAHARALETARRETVEKCLDMLEALGRWMG